MKNFIKILILPIAIITMLSGFAPRVFAMAVTPLSVQFSPNPLFVKPNFLPEDETSGVVTVTNNSDATQTIATEAINVLDNDNFGNLLHLKIVENSIALYDDSLANFFSTAGEFSLGTISAGQTRIFTYTISFIDSSDNSYQGKTLGFDVCVGFQGGQTHCGDTVIGGGNDTGGGGNTGGGGSIPGSGGGGGGGAPITLIISNEQISSILNENESTSITITWDTNKLSTSQVIYDLASGSHTLNLTPPNFGYPSYTIEDTIKVMHHSVLLTGLIPGQTYVYRVVSRASPPTISFEHQFTMPTETRLLAQAGSNNFTNNKNSNAPSGANSIINSEENPLPVEKNNINSNDNLVAGTLLSGFGNFIPNYVLVLILVIILILFII